MSNFITDIKVQKVFHLKDFCIPISETEKKHLIITGRNGSGKTILLNAIAAFFNEMYSFASVKSIAGKYMLENRFVAEKQVGLYCNDAETLLKKYRKQDFIIAFYADERKSRFEESRNPVKPDLKVNKENVGQSKVDQFLNFMVDYKVQEALARNEGKNEDADYIRQWFISFQTILGRIFDDPQLNLKFNYKDYSFFIETDGKSFKFTELSAGYSAVLDIVTDLILKMQEGNNIVRAYEKEGIVLIDEIETHLHLKLQRVILPILTTIFPHIQFIVTTHSPFILSSLPNAVAFDLERRESIEDLTEYSYEALAEGYFGVSTDSSEIQMRLQQLESLIQKEKLSVSEEKELEMYLKDFENIPEVLAPNVKARFYELKRIWNSKAWKYD